MDIKKGLSVIACTFLYGWSFSQDLPVQVYSQQPLFLNPAFAGSMKGLDISQTTNVDYQEQYDGKMIYTPATSFTTDCYFKKIRSGIGLSGFTDRFDPGYDRSTTASAGLNYSFHFSLLKDPGGKAKMYIQPGIGFSYVNLHQQYSNWLMYEDYYNPYPSNTSYADLSAGVLVYTKNLFFSFSASQLNHPHPYESNFGKPILYRGSFAYVIHFDGSKHNFFLEPHIMIMGNKQEGMMVGGINVNYRSFYSGVAYSAWDGAIVNAGVRYKKMRIEYSSMFSASRLRYDYRAGSHSLNIRFLLFNKKNKALVSTADWL